MALFTSIVDLESIRVPDSDFEPESHATEIEALARKILHLEASIHIPVVRSLGIDEYELVSEHLTYYAYLKARELDEELPEQLMVFIMDAKNEDDIRGQLEVTEKIRQVSGGGSGDTDLKLGNLEGQVTQTSEQMLKAIDQLKADFLELKRDLSTEREAHEKNESDTKLPQSVLPLEAFNRILEPAIARDTTSKIAFLGGKKPQKIVQKLQAFKQKNPEQKFRSFAEVLEAIRGESLLSEAKMLEVIDRWN
ncbi:MAG: hypothetical protein KME11_07010 [Timaviella obliquedivisa GSE-PSE-MK23-08B]|jgi:hypothetical protein|nr:hypothetical protein [Timaviella obliquedivisa GSE-PSE-MK23-08B]